MVTNGSGVLSFAAVGASAGQVIQVLSATDSTSRSTGSTSFVTASNTLSVTITPSSASNKIFIIVNSSGQCDGDAQQGYFTIYRGATNLGNGNSGMTVVEFNVNEVKWPMGMSYLDSPNTTSATTYQVYIRATANSVYLNRFNVKGSITCFEIKG